MINKLVGPTPLFWNCVGVAIVILSTGMTYQFTQAESFELQIAEYRLRNGQAIDRALDANKQTKQTVEQLPIAKAKKQELLEPLIESEAVLEQTEDEILSDRTTIN